MIESRNGTYWVYRCEKCGKHYQYAKRKNPASIQCGHQPRQQASRIVETVAECQHRGPVLTTVSGRVAGAGCSGSSAEVFECRHFHEPVLKQGKPPCEDTMREKVPGWKGRTCRECQVPTAKPGPEIVSVGVVITCHNYGRFLRQCLDSILSQSIRPASIVLVDDASEDETHAIAQDYVKRGVRYERVEYRNASQSRNHGAAVSGKPQFLLFVDADNWLPQNYLAELLRAMTAQNIGVAYCRLWQVNERGGTIGWSPAIKPFALANLRRQNLADTCSLVRRAAVEQVGGWKSSRWGLQDWDLWLRIADAGWQFRYVEGTALNYRIHDARMSKAVQGNWQMNRDVMRDSQLTAVVTLFSGRRWNLDRWFADLAALEWERENLHLVAIDNSRDDAFHAALAGRLRMCQLTHTIIRNDARIVEALPAAEFTDTAQQRIDHAVAMNQHLGRLYSTATKYIPGAAAHVLSIEDDVGFPPDTLSVLATEISRLHAVAVSGCLRNRFADRRLLAWTGLNQWVDQVPNAPIRITGTGFYCLLARRDSWDRIAWRPGTHDGAKYPYYDWAACHDLMQDGPIYLAPVRCRHWQADGTCLDC